MERERERASTSGLTMLPMPPRPEDRCISINISAQHPEQTRNKKKTGASQKRLSESRGGDVR
jgi:hypothetical protein